MHHLVNCQLFVRKRLALVLRLPGTWQTGTKSCPALSYGASLPGASKHTVHTQRSGQLSPIIRGGGALEQASMEAMQEMDC